MHNSLWYAPSEERPAHGGTQRLYRFEGSRYSASVVCHQYSYGFQEGLWELAVMHDGRMTTGTPITEPEDDDVIGWLTEDEIQSLLAQIDALQEAR